MRLGNKIIMLTYSVLFIASGCRDCKYKIYKDYIESTCYFEQGFQFEEITVYSFDKSNMPDSFKVIKKFDLILNNENDRKKRIYFNKQNKGYDWFYVQQLESYNVLPINIEKGKWYRIRNLVFRGHPDRAAFINVKDNGMLDVYGHSESKW